RTLGHKFVVMLTDLKYVRIICLPDLEVCAATEGLNHTVKPAELAADKALRAIFQERLAQLAAAGAGSSNRIVAALLVEVPPSSAAGELTEKGTVNSRALQRNRPELLGILFGDRDERVLRIDSQNLES